MDSKVFVVIGKSYSGKNTLIDSILSDKDFCERNKLVRLTRYTTRKPREGEVDGECGYHFISNEEYEKRFKDNPGAITTSFNSAFGELHYTINLDDLKTHQNYIFDADPKYIDKLKEILGKSLCIIFLNPPDYVLFKRFSNRNDNADYDNLKYKEIHRRYLDDLFVFGRNMNNYLSKTNCIIDNNEECCTDIIKEKIQSMIEKQWYNTGILLYNKRSTFLVTVDEIAFSTFYIPHMEFNETEYVIYGEISICNGEIIINSTYGNTVKDAKLIYTKSF